LENTERKEAMNTINRNGNIGAVLLQPNPSNQLEISAETQVKESLAWAEPAPSVEFDEAAGQVSPADDLPPGFYYIHPDDPNCDAISDCYDVDDRESRNPDLEEEGVPVDVEALHAMVVSLRDRASGGSGLVAQPAPALPASGASALAEVVRQVIREEANAPVLWPLVSIWEVIEDFEVQLQHEGCSAKTLKKYRQVWRPFADHFKVFPSEWQAIRAFLKDIALAKGWSSGNESRNQANLSNLYGYASCTRRGSKSGMKRDGRPVLPFNPMEGVGLPDFESAEPNPLSIEEQHRVNELKMNLRDRCIWNLEFGHGWRPVSCEGLTADDVLEAVQRADGFILRTQKRRAGKLTTTRDPAGNPFSWQFRPDIRIWQGNILKGFSTFRPDF